MPLAWSVTEARLEIGGRGGEVLADFAANPQTLAMYSPETPHGRWVEGPVVVAADMAAVRRNRLHGTFLFVNDGRTSPDLNALAAQAIALGIIVSVPNPDPNAAQSTHEAHSSVRVQTHCMVMGQGVGTAAALALDGGTELAGIDVATLQARLRADGAYIEDVPRKELPCN
jgi:hypothetical protein